MEFEEKRILVFGCSKAGKTSMLNTITGQKHAVRDAAVGTTFQTQILEDYEYNGKIYKFIDTAGLDEGDKGTIPSGTAVVNLFQFIRNEDKKGFNLFIMVMRKGVISKTIQRNYELFMNYIKTEKIPTLCVVTGCEDCVPLNKWVEENIGIFEQDYEMKFSSMIGSCFAQERDGRLAGTYEELCKNSKHDVMKMIEETCSIKPHSIIRRGFIPTFKRIWNAFARILNLSNWILCNARLYYILTDAGVDHEQAMEFAEEVDEDKG